MTGTDDGSDHYSQLIRELCALLVTVVSPSGAGAAPGRPVPPVMSPAAAASMLLGASMALMLCGSVTFAIGLLLMPWVAGIALLFGFAGAVSTLSSGVFTNTKAVAAALPPSCNMDRRPDLVVLTDNNNKPRFGYAGSLPAATAY